MNEQDEPCEDSLDLMTAESNLDKSLEDSRITSNQQMNLFQLPDILDKNHSNLVDIYDALDKYSYGKVRRVSKISDASRVTVAKIKNRKIKATIRAANMTDANGNTYLIYPGEREERVEEALRKLAVSGNGTFIDDSAGVIFTLYALQKELKANGHHYKIPELKEAILVNRRASLSVETMDGTAIVDSGFFIAAALVSRSEYLENSKSQCYVRFNPLVTESILRMQFRRYNYSLSMKIKNSLARYMYRRMSLYYTQASSKDPYTPNLVSFLSQSPREISPRMSENIRAMNTALTVLKKCCIVKDWADPVQIKKGRKIIDVKYKIHPHKNFVSQQRMASASLNEKKNLLTNTDAEDMQQEGSEIDFE
ncbi:plasmid replication protein [Endozoicomonas sp. ALC066]|uniref:plasmid replication protein n=1 Tax=Endozoicomonas sp. ALC066 TaxID=3403078 RepID=UPI003BB49B11